MTNNENNGRVWKDTWDFHLISKLGL